MGLERDSMILTLFKNKHTYIICCPPGEELAVINFLITKARDPDSGLDWFDASIMAHQMGQPLTTMALKRLRAAANKESER
jgi:hypothetical protein